MRCCRTGLLSIALSAFTVQLLFGVPLEMNYQGRLLDVTGQPINSNVTVSVGIYTNDLSGAAAYWEDVGVVPVQDGVYSFRFGTGPAVRDALLRGECWLELNINGSPLSPRQKLVAVPYAILSHQVEHVDSNTTFTAGIVPGDAIQDGAVTSNKLAAGVDDRYVNEDGDSVAWLHVMGADDPGQYVFRIYAGSNSVAWARTK